MRVADQLLVRLEGHVGSPARREQVGPLVEHQQRAVRIAPVELAAEVLRVGHAQRRVLDEREAVQIPGHRAVGVVLGEHDEALVLAHELAQRRQRQLSVEDRGVLLDPGAL